MRIDREDYDKGLTSWVRGRMDELCFSAKIYRRPCCLGIPTDMFPEGSVVARVIVSNASGIAMLDRDPRNFRCNNPTLIAASLEIIAELEKEFCAEKHDRL